jgi:hypothetical protein
VSDIAHGGTAGTRPDAGGDDGGRRPRL